MNGKTFAEIVEFFDEHLSEQGNRAFSDYYVGITNDVDRRLFHEHNVNREAMFWVYATAVSKEVAKRVEEYYLDKGMRGDTGGGTSESKIVYSYLITRGTVEDTSQGN